MKIIIKTWPGIILLLVFFSCPLVLADASGDPIDLQEKEPVYTPGSEFADPVPAEPVSEPVAAAEEEEDFFDFDDDGSVAEAESASVSDPFESMNRAIFSFNDKVYRGLLKPVAVGFRVVPEPVRISVRNVFDNLTTPISAINSLLQLKFKNTVSELACFGLNTTVGVLGLFDPASTLNLEDKQQGFGLTLARYGVGHGFYLVLPFLGPSSFRDGLGDLADTGMDPVINDLQFSEIVVIQVVEAETDVSLDKDTYESLYENALDPYLFFRAAYLQNRAGKVQ